MPSQEGVEVKECQDPLHTSDLCFSYIIAYSCVSSCKWNLYIYHCVIRELVSAYLLCEMLDMHLHHCLGVVRWDGLSSEGSGEVFHLQVCNLASPLFIQTLTCSLEEW